MNITRINIDDLNAVLIVEVLKNDYSPKVDKVLTDYRKNASIPGFRKGAVPMSLIQKQYGKAVLLEEVNKILQESLNNYLVEHQIDILGNPMPKVTENFNWDADDYKFDFELGLAPLFSVDLSAKNDIVQYKIIADDTMLNAQIARIQKQYGKIISKDVVEEGNDVSGVFTNEEKGINNRTTLDLEMLANPEIAKSFIGKKVGDVITLKTKGLFNDDHKLMDYLAVSHDDVHGLDVDVTFIIDEVVASEPANLDQELFDKLFGPKVITSVAELKTRIKEDAEKQFEQQSNQKFLNDVTESLITTTKFNLPAEFLKKWIQSAGENPLTPEQAEEEYTRSEKGLRYQLIEGKIIFENKLQTTFEELKDFSSELIKKQMAQFGQMDPTDEDVQGIVARVLSNQDEVKRLSDQLMNEKILNLFKNNIKAPTKEVNYEDFIKVMYNEA
jgi:trigger factor